MKILVLFGPDNYGGSFVVAENIAKEYRKNNHEVIMVVKDFFSIEKYKKDGYKVITINSMKRKISLISDLISVFKLGKLYKKENCDLIHSHTSKGGFYSRICKLLFSRIKVMHTVHGYYKSDNKFKNNVFSFIEKSLLSLGDITTFVNKEDYELAKKWSSKSKLIYIPNGVNVDYLKNERNFDEEVLNIIVSARLVWEKGYKEVIELIKLLSKYKIHFHIVGSGENEKEIKEKLKDNENVTFYGFIDDIRDVLFKAHINLLPSYREGLSLSVLEAMGSGIPTIACAIRGNKELIDSEINGILCEVGNLECFKKAILRYFNDRGLCKKHGEVAKEKVILKYSLKDSYKKYLNEVNGVINEN